MPPRKRRREVLAARLVLANRCSHDARHRNTATTERYAHLSDDPVRVAADRTAASLAAWLEGHQTPVTPLRKEQG